MLFQWPEEFPSNEYLSELHTNTCGPPRFECSDLGGNLIDNTRENAETDSLPIMNSN